jgi:hypothetical protein
MNNKQLFRAGFSLLVLGTALTAASCKAYFGMLDLNEIAEGLVKRPPEVIVVPYKTAYASRESIDPAADLTVYTRNTATGKLAPVSAFTITPLNLAGLSGEERVTVVVTDYPAAGQTASGYYTIWVDDPAPPITRLALNYANPDPGNPEHYDRELYLNGQGKFELDLGPVGWPEYMVIHSVVPIDPKTSQPIAGKRYLLGRRDDETVTLNLDSAGNLHFNPAQHGVVLVSSVEELKMINSGPSNGKYVLEGNLDLLGSSDYDPQEWTPIDKLFGGGVFDGADYTISGMAIGGDPGQGGAPVSRDKNGLFAYMIDSTIKNVTVEGWINTNGKNSGGIVGLAGEPDPTSGMTGFIRNCVSRVTVNGGDKTGGIAGDVSLGVKIENCRNEGSVTGTGERTGGIAGSLTKNGKIENCRNTGSVNGNKDTGGIVGYAEEAVSVKNCRNEGNVTGGGDNTGGIAGYIGDSIVITACYNTGEVKSSGHDYTGGIVGYIVPANGSNIPMASSVTACRNDGKVDGHNYTGGVAGWMGMKDEIIACYNTGEVSGNDSVGGLAGYFLTTNPIVSITASYNIGPVGGTSNVGEVAGYGVASDSNLYVTACYWDFYSPYYPPRPSTAPGSGIGELKKHDLSGSLTDAETKAFSSIDFDPASNYCFPGIRALALTCPEWGTGNGSNGKYWKSGTGIIGRPPLLYWE